MENAEKNGGIHKAELLAPAGDLRTLICAVNAGAGAVYAGGNMFSARAYAANFSQDDLIKGIRYAHLHGAKVHLAVNTLFKNTETSLLFDYLRPLVIAGLDAVIVQDIGAMSIIHRCFPKLEIHASTQCTVTDINGVRFFACMGVKRVVPARELSLREIEEIVKAAHDLNTEIEVFIHGALCYSYSGQCLMSSILGGRSGNRGRCAQPCRLPYSAASEKDIYPLSLKDYNGAYNLDKLLEIGVDSLKIEGRMKSADYVYGVTKIYRKLIDEYYETGKHAGDKDIKELDELGHRGGNTPGYPTMRNGRDMVTLYDASHRSKDTGKADDEIKKTFISGYMDIICGKEMILTLICGETAVTVSGGKVSPAEKAPVDEQYVRDKISALGNTFFEFETLDINMPEEPVFISAKEIKDLRRNAVEELEKQLFAKDTVWEETDINTDHKNQPKELKKQIVVETLSQTKLALELAKPDEIFVCTYAMSDADAQEALKLIKDKNITAGMALPQVFREKRKKDGRESCADSIKTYEKAGAECFLVRNYGGIQAVLDAGISADRIYTDHSVYTWNNESVETLRKLGIKHFTAPLELNSKELSHRDNWDSTFVINALYPLMISAGCVHNTLKSCDISDAEEQLTDRKGKKFKAKSYCSECMSVIYNSLPTDLSGQIKKIKDLGFEAIRIDLCGMDDEMVKEVFEGKLNESTGGHFGRGVE